MSHDTTASGSAGGSPANAQRLLWAGFMAILAAGVGFSIRAGILGQWAEQYGFTQTELGAITGGGLTGFGIIILLSSLIADRIGFGPLMFIAFGMHLVRLLRGAKISPSNACSGACFCLPSEMALQKRW